MQKQISVANIRKYLMMVLESRRENSDPLLKAGCGARKLPYDLDFDLIVDLTVDVLVDFGIIDTNESDEICQ
jgi:hypothetical protein